MMWILFLGGLLIELGVVLFRSFWAYRRWLAVPSIALTSMWIGALLWLDMRLLTLALALVCLYRLFNLIKLAEGRVSESHLLTSARRTSVILGLLSAGLYGVSELDISMGSSDLLVLLVSLQLVSAVCICGITARNLFKTRHHATKHFYSDKELPTVTVAIPARNETAELSSCITAILANDYPKLEILVLDDCSLDRTPEIIKDFAQDGVRFLEGKPPSDRWLAKNYAYDQLSKAASGEYILFCGVDVRLGPSAIRSLVTTFLNKKRVMMSVMPLRFGGGVRTAFIQPMRYWWELALPRRLFNRPPVLSTLWIIKRKTLEKLGGFSAVHRSILPETYFARELVKSDSYAFIRADEELDVRTVKSAHAQLLTSIRTRYPQLRRRPENVLLLTLLETVLLVGPFIVVLTGVIVGFESIHAVALLSAGLLIAAHYQIVSASNPANSMIALINFPIVVLTEIVLLHVSMYRYEFSTVEWKGRNICIPVMRVIPTLPRSENR